MENSANILLLGKTGVGKSSFINYFIGQPLAKVGDGRPVTQDYFTPYEIADGKYPIQIFDTKGLEAMDANEQLDEIIEGVKERNNSDDVMNWFHTIFYCVSMANNRFEEFEANFIRQLRDEISQHIHIILTQCDAVSSNVIGKMRTKIANDIGDMEGIHIFEVVSISKKKRNGEVAEPHGKEEISESVFKLLVSDIASKISIEYASTLRDAWYFLVSRVFKELDDMVDEKAKLKTLIALLKDDDHASDDLENYIDAKFDYMESEMENIQKSTDERFAKILRPAGQLYDSYYGVVTDSYVDRAKLAFDDASDWANIDWLDDIGDEDFLKYFMPKTGRYVDADANYTGNNNLWDYLNTFGSAVDDFFHLKSNIKKMLKDIKLRMLDSLPAHEIKTKAYEHIVAYLTLQSS